MSQTPEPLTRDAILESVADGVFTVDDQCRITSFNRAAEQITGIPRNDAIGKPCYEVFRSSICDDGCALKKTRMTGRPNVDVPAYILNADGGRIPITISTAMLKDKEGRVIGGVETFRDLSLGQQLRSDREKKYTFSRIIGRSEAMQRLFQVLPQFADSSSTILIEGASGTGKELFARAIHELSPRRSKRFVAVNCGAVPDTLLESELFGYRAGAFTDARHDKPGRFEVADGGTILLDEIGNISPAMQVKLLRILQERAFEPLGSVESIKVDVRVIAATNCNLGRLVDEGTFREDLYYRIDIVRLRLPTLSERREDIPLLVDHFVSKFNRRQGKQIVGVSPEVTAILMEHDYPGNIRELENIIEHAFVLCRGRLIEPQHLPHTFREKNGHDLHVSSGSFTLRQLEALHIAEAIRRHGGNRTAAARALGIDSSTLFRKLKSLHIPLPESDGRSQRRKPR